MAKGAQSDSGTTLRMKISELKEAIRICMLARNSVFVHGSPGIGKSDAVKQIGVDTGRPVIDVRMSLLNPVDLRGVPYVDAASSITRWMTPAFLPRVGTPLENAILFLDEMNAAPPAVQAAAYQLVLDRKVGEYTLPDGVDVIAAGNLGTDRAIVYEMSSALRNRFCHFEVVPDLDEWKDWAAKNGIRSEVISYLNYKSDKLFWFDPKVHIRQFPTPRSWSFVSRMLDNVKSIRGITPLIASALGDAVATEFAGFLKVASSLPNAEDIILRGEMNIKAPTETSSLYAFAGALVGVASRTVDDDKLSLKYAQNLSQYCADNLTAEFAVLASKDFARTPIFEKIYTKLILTKHWKNFSSRFGEMIVK